MSKDGTKKYGHNCRKDAAAKHRSRRPDLLRHAKRALWHGMSPQEWIESRKRRVIGCKLHNGGETDPPELLAYTADEAVRWLEEKLMP